MDPSMNNNNNSNNSNNNNNSNNSNTNNNNNTNNSDNPALTADLPEPLGERFILQPHEELRIEIPYSTQKAQWTLQKGSCELWGCELALKNTYEIPQGGGLQLALFSWHGAVVDVQAPSMDISYISSETDANIAFVNTHAQLEALRDEALQQLSQGPRVMVVGPPESGKTSFVKTLVAYATKVGRTPLWVDLDPSDNALSVPGSLAVAPMNQSAVSVESFATCGLPPPNQQQQQQQHAVYPLVMWHGGPKINPDLFPAQVESLASSINARLEEDENARSSGVIVNTNGWIQDEGYQMLLKAAELLEISVILILGHDRLYSMMTNHYKNQPEVVEIPKVLKLPRSGGVVSRSEHLKRQHRSRAVKRYFYGDWIDAPNIGGGSSKTTASEPSTNPASTAKVPQLTPFALQLPTSEVQIYKLSSMALSSSLLPVAQQQTTDTIQMESVSVQESLQHALVAVCHPTAVRNYEASGRARDLWTAGVAGFCVVERLESETDTLHLLSPCAGSLPSKTLLVGDITWME